MASPPDLTAPKRGRMPTRKWWAQQIVALAAILTSWVESGAWDAAEWKLLIAAAAGAATTYLIPNERTPGGAPDAR